MVIYKIWLSPLVFPCFNVFMLQYPAAGKRDITWQSGCELPTGCTLLNLCQLGVPGNG